MALKEVVKIIMPLIRDELSSNKYEIHELMVKSILADKEKNNHFSLSSVKEEIIIKFNLEDFPTELLATILSSLVQQNYLQSNGDEKYIIISVFDPNSAFKKMDDCFSEFRHFIQKRMKDYDPFIHKVFKPTFEASLYKVIEIFVENDDFYNNQINNISDDGAEKSLIKIAFENGIVKPSDFVNLFFDFINSNNEKMDEFIFLSYKAAISYDVLKRGYILSKTAIDFGNGGLLLLDTNTIISLICSTDNTHKLADSAITLSKKLNFDIVYAKETEEEYYRLLKSADYQMKIKGFHDHQKQVVDNQLIKDFINKKKGSWADYYSEISNIELYLKAKYGIYKYEKTEFEQNDLKNSIEDYIDIVYSTLLKVTSKEKNRNAIDHDLYTLKLLVNLSDVEDDLAFNCPWLLSFDTTLNSINDLIVRYFSHLKFGYVIHPKNWLNTLLVYSNVEIDEEKKSIIVKAIMDYMIFPTKNVLELDDYAILVTNKIGLEEENEDFIMHLLTTSPLKRSLENALQSNDVERVADITTEILTDSDLIEIAKSQSATKMENEKLKQQLQTVAEDMKIERAIRKLLENVVMNQNSNFTFAIEGANENVSKIFSSILSKIESTDKDLFNEIVLEKSKDKTISKKDAITILQKLRSTLKCGKETAHDILHIAQFIPTLISYMNGS